MNDWDTSIDAVDYKYASMQVGIMAKEIEDSMDEIYSSSKSTRMLIQALEALESTGGLDFAVLKHPELGDIWGKYTRQREDRRKRSAALKKLESTLSREEMELLGIDRLVK